MELKTSVSTTTSYIIGTLREYLVADLAFAHTGRSMRPTLAIVTAWSAHAPAFIATVERLEARTLREAVSLNVRGDQQRLDAWCLAEVRTGLAESFPDPSASTPLAS